MPVESQASAVKLERAVQIGIVVRDLKQTTELLTSLFGIGPFHYIEWPNRPDSRYWFRGQMWSPPVCGSGKLSDGPAGWELKNANYLKEPIAAARQGYIPVGFTPA